MKKFCTYLFLVVMAIIFAFPFYFLIVSATNKSSDIMQGVLTPGTYFIENLRNLTSQYDIWTAAKNSLVISLLQTILSIFLASLAGYGFEIHQSKGKEIVFRILLLSMMIPFAALMVPLFQMFGTLSAVAPIIGIDTISAVILPYLSTAFLIFFFRQNTKMFPKALLEAGRIDGLSELGLFFRIYVPTMKTTYAAAGIIAFLNSWNNYLWPLIVIQSPSKQTLPLMISNLGSSYTPDFGLMMMAIFIATIPTAFVFFALQKYFVAGMLGSVK
ncbi:hypothetical protein RV01_GL001295 [Enterococcus dispar]|nr:hypothetical protein RV01_GL001295 [Enterococcus dispar]